MQALASKPAPLFSKGASVRLLQSTLAVLDDADAEVIIPEGAIGKVVAVRPTSSPAGEQGAWLYDVEVETSQGAAWLIYDATDVAQIAAEG